MNSLTRCGLIGCLALVLLAGCTTTTHKSTDITPLQYQTSEVKESQLMDVGVIVFDPGVEELAEDKHAITLPEIRRAESRYMPLILSQTLQNNGGWGAVRVIPTHEAAVDLYVSGKILHSDGELLRLEIAVSDASGVQWYSRKYEEKVSQYIYTEGGSSPVEPFQGIYNRIANDMQEFRQKLSDVNIQQVRRIAALRFAQSFSKEAFSQYLVKDKGGEYRIVRLPPENDPVLQRVQAMRERDYLFIDTLQDYYSSFALEMQRPYHEWRRATYDEVVALREVRSESRNQMIAGAAAILGGIIAAGSNNGSARAAANVGLIGGAFLIKGGLDKRAESQIHVEALQELGDSLGADIEPRVIELQDRTVTLTGTVDNQYGQWREILHEIYVTETGDGLITEQTIGQKQ